MTEIFKALSAVKSDLGAVTKGGTMKGGSFSYKYRSIDDVLNKLHPILVEHGVVGPVPRLVSYDSNGKKVLAHYEYSWFAQDGSSVSGGTLGEGDDSGDKRANKASTGALKTFLAQSLAIPFETDDPDDYPSPTEDAKPASKPAEKPKADTPAPSAQGGERKCEQCTYAIGAGDPIKRKAGKTYHKQCFEDKDKAPAESAPANTDDISLILDTFEGSAEA